MVLSVTPRTQVPGPRTRHTDPDLQVLLSGMGIAACCRARGYKAMRGMLAAEWHLSCKLIANHRFSLSKTTVLPA